MRHAVKVSLLGFALLLPACPTPQPGCEEDTDPDCELVDAGQPPPDECNSRQEALDLPECKVALEVAKVAHISYSGDDDWYLVEMPGNLTARSLVHVSGGYQAPNTAVNLALSLLLEDGSSSLARGVDHHGQGTPRPVNLVVPFTQSGAKLLVLVQDEKAAGSGNFDAKQPYSFTVSVVENPDANEPNDETPTAINLAAGAVQVGQATGYLATADDVDRFTIVAPAGRKVLYLRISAPRAMPSALYRMSYVLLDSTQKPVAEGRMDNEFLAVDLATARLTTAGAYTLVLQGYRPNGVDGPIPGNMTLMYTVDVRLMDEVDPNEPNDTTLTARRATGITAVGGSQTFTGRLGYVPDPDWYQVDLPANAAPTVLYYRVTPAAGGGRFPALPGRLDRQLKVFREVTGGTLVQNQQECLNNPAVCPKGYAQGDDYTQLLVDGFCNSGNPPKCLWANREEHPSFTNFRNFEGAIQVPPHAAALKYLLVVDDDGNDFADDRDYTLRLEWRADPDDAARFSGAVEGTTTLALPELSAAGFPVPAPGAATFTGTLASGHGNLLSHDPNRGEGVRGPQDYDAVPSDVDKYELTLPAVPDGGTGFLDRTWALQWDVQNTDGGVAPYDVALKVTFCDGVTAPGVCTAVGPALLSYTGAALRSWQNDSPYQPIYDRASVGGVTTVTARAFGCFCIEPRFVRGGKLTLEVEAVDRTDFTPLPYTVRTSLTAYPQSYGVAAGGTKSCPAPTVNPDGGSSGGCRFTQ